MAHGSFCGWCACLYSWEVFTPVTNTTRLNHPPLSLIRKERAIERDQSN